MKKSYVKPEMDVQEFAAEDMIMSSGSNAECSGTYIVLDGDVDLNQCPTWWADLIGGNN